VEREGKEKWDIMYASKLVGLQGSRTGRLLRYDPNTGKVDLLATGMHFANGIAVDKDEKFVVIAETFQAQVRKYHLVGERKGKLDVLVNELPGLPDGADCSHENGKCYVVIPSGRFSGFISSSCFCVKIFPQNQNSFFFLFKLNRVF